jgi:hypothetical protein
MTLIALSELFPAVAWMTKARTRPSLRERRSLVQAG